MKQAGAPQEPLLVGRLAWITGLRLALLLALLTIVAFFYLRGDLSAYPDSLRHMLRILGGGFILAALYALALRSRRSLVRLAYVQIVLDQITWTAIVFVSGGATSGATSFYALTCLVGAVLIGMRGAALAAILGLGLYALMCAAFLNGWISPPPDQPFASYAVTATDLVYPFLVNGLGIGVVSLLAGYLAERLRLTGGALADAMNRALEAERLAVLGKLAAGLAHEIRNPLGSIRGSIEMLRESPALQDEDKQLCDIIFREAARLNNLVGDMVDLAKPRPAHAEAVDLAALSREVVALAARSERAEDVRVVYAGPERTVVRCDGAQMRQVLWNLVRNAKEVSPAGSEVVVRVESPLEGRALLAVEDSGPGINDGQKEKIFDAFYSTRSHGTGIGLAVVKRIMDEHAPMGAAISIEQSPAGGASFRVSLSTDVAGLRPSGRPPPMRME